MLFIFIKYIMNLSLDTILTNARELVSRLRRDDTTADTAVNQAQYVQERILSMKQVRETKFVYVGVPLENKISRNLIFHRRCNPFIKIDEHS